MAKHSDKCNFALEKSIQCKFSLKFLEIYFNYSYNDVENKK